MSRSRARLSTTVDLEADRRLRALARATGLPLGVVLDAAARALLRSRRLDPLVLIAPARRGRPTRDEAERRIGALAQVARRGGRPLGG